MRTKRFAKAQVADEPRAIAYPSDVERASWPETFGRKAPLHLEIGMGSGRHLAYTALVQPDLNHVGVEEKFYRVLKAARWLDMLAIDHVRFLVGDLFEMEQAFGPGELAAITLLFPDPWPRAKGERFRLTNPKLVERYWHWLKSGGTLTFRTDHAWMYTYSRERLRRQGFAIEEAVAVERVISDFEARYLEEGRPIYGLVATRP